MIMDFRLFSCWQINHIYNLQVCPWFVFSRQAKLKQAKGSTTDLGFWGIFLFFPPLLLSGCFKDSKGQSNHTAGKRNQMIMERITTELLIKRLVKMNFWEWEKAFPPFSLWCLISTSPAAPHTFANNLTPSSPHSNPDILLLEMVMGNKNQKPTGQSLKSRGNSLLNLTAERTFSAFQFYMGEKNPD